MANATAEIIEDCDLIVRLGWEADARFPQHLHNVLGQNTFAAAHFTIDIQSRRLIAIDPGFVFRLFQDPHTGLRIGVSNLLEVGIDVAVMEAKAFQEP